MLPSEMALLAHGWPRKVADNPDGAAAAAAAGGTVVSLSSFNSQDEEGSIMEEQYYLPGECVPYILWFGKHMTCRVLRVESSGLPSAAACGE